MALTPYLGLSVLDNDNPGGLAGNALQDNFKELATRTSYLHGEEVRIVGADIGVTVAASDSSIKDRANADYVCTGVTGNRIDHTAIQSAIDADEGPVHLSAGTYWLGGTIQIKRHSTRLLGAGFNTAVLRYRGDVVANAIAGDGSNYQHCEFKNFKIADHENYTGVGLNATNLTHARFERLYFYQCAGGLLLDTTCYYSLIEQCLAGMRADATYGFKAGNGANDNTFLRCKCAMTAGTSASGYQILGSSNDLFSCNVECSEDVADAIAFDVQGVYTAIYSPYIEKIGTGVELSGGSSDKTLIVGGHWDCPTADVTNTDGGKLLQLDSQNCNVYIGRDAGRLYVGKDNDASLRFNANDLIVDISEATADSGTPDCIVKLQDAAGASQFKVIDSSSNVRGYIDSDGNFMCFGSIKNANMKTGVDQAAAGAVAGELWADSNDGYTVKLGQ